MFVLLLLVACDFRSPRRDEVLVVVSVDHGQEMISVVRQDLRKLARSKSPLATIRKDKESLIYIDNLSQSELSKLLAEFSKLHTRGKLLPTDQKRVYVYHFIE